MFGQLFSKRAEIIELKKEIEALKQLISRDPLTGLYNRRGVTEEVARIISAITCPQARVNKRRQKPTLDTLTLFFLDIDNFKKLNDEYGHEVGDQALVHVATALTNLTRATDIIARWGGEEFIVVLPGETTAGALVVAEHIRVGLKDSPLLISSGKIELTASIGVAEYRESDDAFADLVRRADRAMYAAKAQGKNKVVTE